MLVVLLLGSAALLGGSFGACLLVTVIAVHRADHGQRRTSSNCDAFARRLLTGSHGNDFSSDTEDSQ